MLIPGHNPGPYTGAGTNTYLLVGRPTVLIDTATGDHRHLTELAHALDVSGVTLDHVVVTHAHGDHIGGVDAIAARWPSAIFLKYPWPDRDAAHPVPWRALRDGDRLDVGGTTLIVLHTPGHAPDHVALHDERSGVVYAGDLVFSGTTVVIPASHGGDLRAYLASLRRIRDVSPSRLLPAHGAPIDDPGAVIDAYLLHRARREAQILQVLEEGGAAEVPTILRRVYGELPEELTRAAGENVMAHLRKLEMEGAAACEEDGAWRLIASS